MHQLIVTILNFFLPYSAIGYSLLYAFTQKQRIKNSRRLNSHRQQPVNNRITVPSFVDDVDLISDTNSQNAYGLISSLDIYAQKHPD